jgi:predicted transcriptional regulator
MAALFPGYVGELASAAMISRTLDETIERRESCSLEPIRDYLTTDHVLLKDDYSDTQLAEIFLHHRVLVVPLASDGRVHAVVTRNDFFRALAERLGV